jgi:hypothetical protein
MSKCNLVEYNETDSLESENANITGENNVDCNFYAKGIIHQEFVLPKKDGKGRIYKEMMKKKIDCSSSLH